MAAQQRLAQYGGVEITIHKAFPWQLGYSLGAAQKDCYEVGTQPSQNCKYWQPSSVQMCLLFEVGQRSLPVGANLSLPSLDLHVVLGKSQPSWFPLLGLPDLPAAVWQFLRS